MNDKLAKIETALSPYTPRTHEHAWRQAEIVAASRLYGLGSPEAAYVVLMTGNDLGLSQSQALRGVKIIDGQPSPSADTLHAVVISSPLCEYFREVETTSKQSTWETKRRGNPVVRSTFTIEQAEQAGLLSRGPKSNWAKYPERMLKARAKAYLARDVYPDLTLGLYTPEELGATPVEVEVTQVDVIPDTPIGMVPTDPEPWQQRMRDAGDVRLATQIGKDAYEASDRDPAVRSEAIGIINEMKGAE
jgi:hypothetical protein